MSLDEPSKPRASTASPEFWKMPAAWWARGLPLAAPHHQRCGLIGGGAVPRPGEVSLGHNGVLFLDELPEFQRNVLEVMRQPLEDGSVTIARAAVSVTFPSRFMLAAAMNPCPCGYFGDPTRECHCTPPMIQRYVSKISGPLLIASIFTSRYPPEIQRAEGALIFRGFGSGPPKGDRCTQQADRALSRR